MYFAIEPAQPDLNLQLAQSLAELYRTHAGSSLYVFALVDGIFDEQLLAKRPWSRQPKYSLYEGTDLEAFGPASPHLLAAPTDIAEQNDWLGKILAACAGKPMLSFIASALETPELQRHFLPYLVARTEDLTEWPLRWGDTRVLPEILSVLEPGQREHLFSPLHVWWSIQRDGTLISWRGQSSAAPLPADFEKLPLSDKAFAHLVDKAEADAVLANIHDTQPDLLEQHRAAECHARVAEHLAIADQHGIDVANARQHFSMLSLCLREQFIQHPDMTALLQRTRQGAVYAAEIKALPERFWQEAG